MLSAVTIETDFIYHFAFFLFDSFSNLECQSIDILSWQILISFRESFYREIFNLNDWNEEEVANNILQSFEIKLFPYKVENKLLPTFRQKYF